MKIILVSLIFFLSSSVFAERFEYTGKVLEIVSNENTSGSTNSSLAVVYISDFKNAGECYVAGSTGHVSLRIRDNDHGKFHMSTFLAAYMADKPVRVRVNDANLDGSGVCYLEQVRINREFGS